MGTGASRYLKRPLKNFNVENRAHKLIDNTLKAKPAPLHESSKQFIDHFITENKDMLDKEVFTKNTGLDDRLKGMVVDTTSPGEIISKKRSLPEDRSQTAETEYGYTEPLKVKDGHLSIRQTMEMLGKHFIEPEKYPAHSMAADYSISEEDAKMILQYFKVFRLQLPQKESSVDDSTQTFLQPPLLQASKERDGEEVNEKKT